MLNEKFIICFKITIKWNLTKSHATRILTKSSDTKITSPLGEVSNSLGLSFVVYFLAAS